MLLLRIGLVPDGMRARIKDFDASVVGFRSSCSRLKDCKGRALSLSPVPLVLSGIIYRQFNAATNCCWSMWSRSPANTLRLSDFNLSTPGSVRATIMLAKLIECQWAFDPMVVASFGLQMRSGAKGCS